MFRLSYRKRVILLHQQKIKVVGCFSSCVLFHICFFLTSVTRKFEYLHFLKTKKIGPMKECQCNFA